MDDEVENEATAAGGAEASSTSRISATNEIEGEGEEENRMMNSEEVKTEEGKAICSSEDSISTLHVEENKQDDLIGSEYSSSNNIIGLNMRHEETLEATILEGTCKQNQMDKKHST